MALLVFVSLLLAGTSGTWAGKLEVSLDTNTITVHEGSDHPAHVGLLPLFRSAPQGIGVGKAGMELGVTDSPKPHCDADTLTECLAKFNAVIGFKGSSVQEFITYFYTFIAKDPKTNYPKFCGALAALGKCLGPDRHFCFSVENLMRELRMSYSDANMAHSLFETFNFECRPDILKVLVENYACIVKEAASGKATLAACQSTFEKAVEKDPRRICDYAQTFQECQLAVYSPCGKEVERVLCEAFQVSIHASIEQCHTRCPHAQSATSLLAAGIAAQSAAMKKVLAGTGSCDVTTLNTCVTQFSSQIGFSGNNVEDFMQFMLTYLSPSNCKEHYPNLCQYMGNLGTCLGSNTGCFTTDNLESELGLSDQDANTLSTMYNKYIFECRTTNTPAIINTCTCVLQAQRTLSNAMKLLNCTTDMVDCTMKDLSAANICKCTKTYISCYDSIYSTCSTQAGNIECLELKYLLTDSLAVCTDTSDVCSSGNPTTANPANPTASPTSSASYVQTTALATTALLLLNFLPRIH